MVNRYVIKNLNNDGYYKGRDGYYKGRSYVDWTTDVDAAAKFDNLGGIQDEVMWWESHEFDIFDGITFTVITIHEVDD